VWERLAGGGLERNTSEDPLSERHKGAKDQLQRLNLNHWGRMFPCVPGRERGI